MVGAVVLISALHSPEGVCNAVWDRKLRMCFGVVECLSGHMVGVRVHSAPLTNMVDKVGLKEFENQNIHV